MYAVLVEPRLDTIRTWARAGLLEKDICENLGVSQSAFSEYKLKFSALKGALKTGKDDADAKVEAALFKSACGYEYEEVTITKILPPGIHSLSQLSEKEVKRLPAELKIVRKHMSPNTAHAIFWMKNRRPDLWRDRQQVEMGGADGKPLTVAPVVMYMPDNGRGDANYNKDTEKGGG